jgi:hypothetical protein
MKWALVALIFACGTAAQIVHYVQMHRAEPREHDVPRPFFLGCGANPATLTDSNDFFGHILTGDGRDNGDCILLFNAEIYARMECRAWDSIFGIETEVLRGNGTSSGVRFRHVGPRREVFYRCEAKPWETTTRGIE